MCDSDGIPLLGKRLATYSPETDYRLTNAAAFCLAIFVASFTLWQFGKVGDSRLAIVAATALLAELYCWLRIRIHALSRVHLHQNGIRIHVGCGRREVLWSEVLAVYQTPLLGIRTIRDQPAGWILRIDLVDGKRIRIRSLEGIRALGYRIQEQLGRRLLSRYQEAFHQGRWIRFGKRLAVCTSGICVGVRPVSWFEINNIVIDEEDGIRIECTTDRNQWLRLPVRTVANVHLLSELLEWIRRLHIRSLEEVEREIDDGRAAGVSEYTPELDSDLDDFIGNPIVTEDEFRHGEVIANELLDDLQRSRPRRPR